MELCSLLISFDCLCIEPMTPILEYSIQHLESSIHKNSPQRMTHQFDSDIYHLIFKKKSSYQCFSNSMRAQDKDQVSKKDMQK